MIITGRIWRIPMPCIRGYIPTGKLKEWVDADYARWERWYWVRFMERWNALMGSTRR